MTKDINNGFDRWVLSEDINACIFTNVSAALGRRAETPCFLKKIIYEEKPLSRQCTVSHCQRYCPIFHPTGH